jgi:hypothetical protein
MIVLYASAHQLDKVESLAPIQIGGPIFEGVSKANSFRVDECSITVNEAEAGDVGVVDGIDCFGRRNCINADY